MRKVQSLILVTLFAFIALSLAVSSANAQNLKIGYVDDERVTQNYQAWIRAQEQWDIELKAWDEEAVTKQTEFEEMLAEYDKQKLILSEGTAERKHKDLVEPLQKNITDAIRLLAEEEGYDVIFTLQSGLGYIRETYDLTEKVLEYLDRLDQ
jgi:Skp family chaperone for outer membrane proteins